MGEADFFSPTNMLFSNPKLWRGFLKGRKRELRVRWTKDRAAAYWPPPGDKELAGKSQWLLSSCSHKSDPLVIVTMEGWVTLQLSLSIPRLDSGIFKQALFTLLFIIYLIITSSVVYQNMKKERKMYLVWLQYFITQNTVDFVGAIFHDDSE